MSESRVDECRCETECRCDEIAQLKQHCLNLENALIPFAHPDLCKFMSGNVEGISSIVFQRNTAMLRIKDFQNARVALGYELE